MERKKDPLSVIPRGSHLQYHKFLSGRIVRGIALSCLQTFTVNNGSLIYIIADKLKEQES